jgi:glucan 1,3-beta-glucosidase
MNAGLLCAELFSQSFKISMQNTLNNQKKIRGVNLGAWLVLEKWMTPSLFVGLKADDETAWSIEQGDQAKKTLTQHWQSFITREDFQWLASIGINAVRIPLGHWIFGPDYPYHASYGENRYPYVVGGIHILDQAFDWAVEFDLDIWLDLHAAPGCQNGFDNGGISGVCDWHTRMEYIDYSVTVLGRLAERYKNNPALKAIEVLNEPHWDIPTEILVNYVADAYRQIRFSCPAQKVEVVFHDGFRAYKEYIGKLQSAEFDNLVFDIHRYQCFSKDDTDANIYQHLSKAINDRKQEADDIISHSGRRTYVAEWSLGLDPKMSDLWGANLSDFQQTQMDNFQQTLAYRAYAATQLLSFENYSGWFFWSYKTENMPQWSFRDCVEKGWLPNYFA